MAALRVRSMPVSRSDFTCSFNHGEAACGAFGDCLIKQSVLLMQGFVAGAPMSAVTGALLR
jgi:hypothetical protein